MDKQAVLVGEMILDGEPRITLYAESAIPLSKSGIAVLKDKLAFLLNSRFRPSDPDTSKRPPKLKNGDSPGH